MQNPPPTQLDLKFDKFSCTRSRDAAPSHERIRTDLS